MLALSFMLLCSPTLFAQTVANMDSLKAEEKTTAISLKLTGNLTTQGNSDFRQMRDLCWQLRNVDLSEATCPVIPKNAFHSRHHLQKILLPQRVQQIGSQAFFACDNLQELHLPMSLKQVDAAAFSGCKKLKHIVIEGTPLLAEYAFAHLSGLQTVKVNSKIPPRADIRVKVKNKP